MTVIDRIENGFPERVRPVFLPLLLFLFVFSSFASAEEPWREMYDGLLERGYYDTAVDYVTLFRSNPKCPAEMKRELDYLEGRALLAQVRGASSAEREVYLKKSRTLLTKFLDANPNHPDAFDASAQLATISVREGERILSQIKDGTPEAEKKKLNEDARKVFQQAQETYRQAVALARKEVEKIKADSRAKKEDKELLYGTYLELRLSETELSVQIAATYEPGGQKKALLEQARTQLEDLYEKYEAYPGGYRAHFKAAQVSVELGEIDDAMEKLEDISSLKTQPSVFALKTEAYLLYCQIALQDKNPARLFGAIRNYNDWKNVSQLPERYYRTQEGLELILRSGEAALALYDLRESDKKQFNEAGKEVFAEGKDTSLKLFNQLDDVAFEAFDFVHKQRSPFSMDAENFLRLPLFAKRAKDIESGGGPIDFADAQQWVNRAWSDFVQANLEADEAVSAAAVSEAQQRKKKAQAQVDRAMYHAFSLGARRANSEALDQLRLQWATLKFLSNQYEESEILTDYLLYRRPSFESATRAADIALRSSRAQLRQARKDEEPEEVVALLSSKLQEKSQYIIDRWKGASGDILPIVQDAINAQMELAIVSGDMDRAQAVLKQIPENTVQFARSRIQLGQAIWSDYLSREKSGGDDLSLDDQKKRRDMARSILKDGMNKLLSRTNGGSSSDTTAMYAALSLAQIALMVDDPSDADKWLSHPNIGPVTIAQIQADRLRKRVQEAQSQSESAEDSSSQEESSDSEEKNGGNSETKEETLTDSFQITALTLGLRTKVALQDFDGADAMMNSLELFVSRGEGSQERLTNVYLQIGKQLEDQIHTLRVEAQSDSKAEERLESLSLGFEKFLDRCSERSAGNTYLTMRWIGDTFYGMANGLTGGDEKNTAKSQDYYTKAGRTYIRILQRLEQEPDWAPQDGVATFVSIRLAQCLANTRRYPQALKRLLPILEKNENNLELQFTAAQLYEDWGSVDRTYYVRAIQGGEPQTNGKNRIWGWNRIVTLLSKNLSKSDLYRERFYEAIEHKLECRRLWMEGCKPEEKKKQAMGGVNELLRLQQVQPDLGGGAQKRRLDAILRQFQSVAGEEPTGFPEDTAPSIGSSVSGQEE